MFVGLDVTSWREPELRVDVVDQQAASIAWIDQDDVWTFCTEGRMA
jgi:hypothetical protein